MLSHRVARLMATYLVAGAAILIVLAHVLWLVERRENPLFQRGYLRGVGEGVWGVIMIIATGEFGDRESSRVAKRIVIAGLWLFGVVLIAQFTATVTSSLTVQQLQCSIRGPDDLPGKANGGRGDAGREAGSARGMAPHSPAYVILPLHLFLSEAAGI